MGSKILNLSAIYSKIKDLNETLRNINTELSKKISKNENDHTSFLKADGNTDSSGRLFTTNDDGRITNVIDKVNNQAILKTSDDQGFVKSDGRIESNETFDTLFQKVRNLDEYTIRKDDTKADAFVKGDGHLDDSGRLFKYTDENKLNQAILKTSNDEGFLKSNGNKDNSGQLIPQDKLDKIDNHEHGNITHDGKIKGVEQGTVIVDGYLGYKNNIITKAGYIHGDKILPTTIPDGAIKNKAITTDKIANNSITLDKINTNVTDTTDGGTENSNKLITSGAVWKGLLNKVNITNGTNQITDSKSSEYNALGFSGNNRTQREINLAINSKINQLIRTSREVITLEDINDIANGEFMFNKIGNLVICTFNFTYQSDDGSSNNTVYICDVPQGYYPDPNKYISNKISDYHLFGEFPDPTKTSGGRTYMKITQSNHIGNTIFGSNSSKPRISCYSKTTNTQHIVRGQLIWTTS